MSQTGRILCMNTGCTGCPHCSAEMAALMDDFVAGRYRSLSNRLTALTHRTLRVLAASPRHPANRMLAADGTLPSPPSSALDDAIRERRRPRTAEERPARLAATLAAGRSEIAPAAPDLRSAATKTPAPARPDLAEAIRQHRSVNAKENNHGSR